MTLDDALARALGSQRPEAMRDLVALLSRGSGLPGQTANLALARVFADACGMSQGGPALARRMASMSGDEAPGGSPLEMIPLCGVLAAGACAVHQPASRADMLAVIHDACDDVRFRVRDAVPVALGQMGTHEGDALLPDLEPFLEGYFHAAAVLIALAQTHKVAGVEPIVHILSKALELIDGSPRAAARWPGYKALMVALEASIAPLALRAGAPVLELIAGFRTSDPHLRDMLSRALDDKRLRTRLREAHQHATSGLAAQTKAPRDPRSLPGPTRKRGGGRRR
jgi:hypothetical protein